MRDFVNRNYFPTAMTFGVMFILVVFSLKGSPVPVKDPHTSPEGKMVTGSWHVKFGAHEYVMQFKANGDYSARKVIHEVTGIPPFTAYYAGTWTVKDGKVHVVEEEVKNKWQSEWSAEFGRTASGKLIGITGSDNLVVMTKEK